MALTAARAESDGIRTWTTTADSSTGIKPALNTRV